MNSIQGVPIQTTYWNEMEPNLTVLIIIGIVIIIYYLLFSTLGKTTTGDSVNGKGLLFMEILLWGMFVLLVVLNGMTYLFNIDITASIKNLFSPIPELDIIVDSDNLAGDRISNNSPVPELKLTKQVFHIPDNTRTYQDAKAICRAYDARLATWKEIDTAYDKGADWCSYGWSDGQMALFPTQYNKWATLQGKKGHEHDCGRPGINGGYIANPDVKFGVNCYGYKPKMTQEEAEAMKLSPLYPKTKREMAFDKRVDYMRNNLAEVAVAPFNHNNWSVI